LIGADRPYAKKMQFYARQKNFLDQYFDGENPSFDLPLNPHGTDYQKNVWAIMLEIPYGKFLTYGEIADQLKSHARAVGMACGQNPIPIIIPRHRALGKGGKLTDFSGGDGIKTKRYLLDLEEIYDNLKLPF